MLSLNAGGERDCAMRAKVRRRRAAFALALIVIVAGAIVLVNPRLTRYVESDAFRAELEKQTAKGLHFPAGTYLLIRRTGFLSAASDGFKARNGRKALTALDARGITARFDPFGILLRRWQLDDVHIDGGEVGIQTYEPEPEPSPSKPWYHIFLPNRVYLRKVWSEPADVTWRFRNEKGGFFGTRLLITPHGRDFEYRATDGTLKGALIPDLPLRHTHLLITKTLLTLYELDLAPGPGGEGFIHAEGTAGTREDKSVNFKVKFEKLPLREWLPASWREHASGLAAGDVHWSGPNPKLENSRVRASLRVGEGRVSGLPFLQTLGRITGKKSIEQLTLNECSAELDWKSPLVEIKDIAVEDKGKFRIEGAISIRERSLGGAIRLGFAREYLEWLPHPEEVFASEKAGYLWTTVHLSGTIDEPGQDLSPRIIEALKESPGAFLKLILGQLGDWLKDTFGD
ncbi:MAG TPA: hypothetical protein VH252_06085 [Chthoniobacterales bacterium]|nr:hypothetical protein [Chthoniobacterales bacterium]